jgi:hypothetical protein
VTPPLFIYVAMSLFDVSNLCLYFMFYFMFYLTSLFYVSILSLYVMSPRQPASSLSHQASKHAIPMQYPFCRLWSPVTRLGNQVQPSRGRFGKFHGWSQLGYLSSYRAYALGLVLGEGLVIYMLKSTDRYLTDRYTADR